MNKSLVHLLTFYIPRREWRLAARHYLREYSREGARLFREFKKAPVASGTVLLCEPNNGHSECVIGFAKYLLDLGYKVDVLLTVKNLHENVFCRFRHPDLRVFGYGQHLLRKVLRLDKIKNYEFVMVTTTWCFWTNRRSLSQTIGYTPQGKGQTLFVEHEISNIDIFGMQREEAEHRIITLGKFERGIMVNPHFFGEVKLTPRSREETRFVVIGTLSKECRDHTLLFEAMRQLRRSGQKFTVSLIGNGNVANIPEDLRPYFNIKGRLSFADMYAEMEKADFFLPLLNPENPLHRRYITTGVTGSAQLIYGFAKPCLIHKNFAEFYSFTPENSIIYDTDFGQAMQQAVSISPEAYERMQQNLKQTAKQIYDESLQNLRGILKN